MATHKDALDERLERLTPEDFRRGLRAFSAKIREAESSWLQTCVRCGLCADSCHYFRADGELESIPAYKLELAASVFRRNFTAAGRLAPALVGARSLDKEMARRWIEAIFGRCSLCGRCSLNCTTGVHIAGVLRAARGALAEMGLVPDDLQATVDLSLSTGNNMGITRQDWLDTVEWIGEELRTETGDPAAGIPVDKTGAKVLFTVNPREPKFYPLSLQASAAVFHAAGEDWTVASEGWDLTNYGLFTGNVEQGRAISENLVRSMERLGCRTLVIGECGHGFAAARWEAPEWRQEGYRFEVRSFLEVMEDYLLEGRIRVDRSRHPGKVTLHDPCNLVRSGGVSEPQRTVLRRTVTRLVEMSPCGRENFCCGGGGGQLSMARFRAKRLQAGSVKAEQIRKTGAATVVAPCHNCIDQLMELNREYKLGVAIKTVAEMVADALIRPACAGMRGEA
ncbi:MAG: (Fe-S)-binding protein [Candidatus Eisenbacteria bacterium]|nr:(Fe-S)-binding protein [Candidatus Eisenbacteria bacterium]